MSGHTANTDSYYVCLNAGCGLTDSFKAADMLSSMGAAVQQPPNRQSRILRADMDEGALKAAQEHFGPQWIVPAQDGIPRTMPPA